MTSRVSADNCGCPRSEVQPHPYDVTHTRYFAPSPADTPDPTTSHLYLRLVPVPFVPYQYRVEHLRLPFTAPNSTARMHPPVDLGIVASPNGGVRWEFGTDRTPEGWKDDPKAAAVALARSAGLLEQYTGGVSVGVLS